MAKPKSWLPGPQPNIREQRWQATWCASKLPQTWYLDYCWWYTSCMNVYVLCDHNSWDFGMQNHARSLSSTVSVPFRGSCGRLLWHAYLGPKYLQRKGMQVPTVKGLYPLIYGEKDYRVVGTSLCRHQNCENNGTKALKGNIVLHTCGVRVFICT